MRSFLPAASEFASLMQTFAVFGAGFLMRPLGAIVLGGAHASSGHARGLASVAGWRIVLAGMLLTAMTTMTFV